MCFDAVVASTSLAALIVAESAPEHQVRDMNDEINKLLREKGHWERRIIELGGPNYFAVSRQLIDESGAASSGSGYKYFGAARELPGVKELLREEAPPPPKRTRFELWRSVDPDYYGYRDEDDGVLVKVEAEAEKKALVKAKRDWEAEQEKKRLARQHAAACALAATRASASTTSARVHGWLASCEWTTRPRHSLRARRAPPPL